MRTGSAEFLKQSLSHFPASAYLTLIEISYEHFEKTYRFVNNIVDFESNGILYLARGFSGSFPSESGDEVGLVNLSIWNGDMYLSDDYLQHPKAPKNLKMQLVMATEPNNVIQKYEYETKQNLGAAEALAVVASRKVSTFAWITMDPLRYKALHAQQQAGD